MQTVLRITKTVIATAGALAAGAGPSADAECGPLYDVSQKEILDAMGPHADYSLTATTNEARFGAEVLFRLVRARQGVDPDHTPLLIRQTFWFGAHMKVAGVSMSEMSIAARLAYEHGQDVEVEYGIDRVIESVDAGPVPLMALSVRAFWPADGPSKYSYMDTLAVPRLKITDRRDIRFKLLEYPKFFVLDQVTGISGRPLGFFPSLFAVLGEPDMVDDRIAIDSSDDSSNQWQVMRGRGRGFLGISKTLEATVEPNGRGHEGVPAGRPELSLLMEQLKAPLRVRYKPPRC